MRLPLLSLVFCSLLVLSNAACAIEKKLHQSVTRVALSSYQLCLAYSKQPDLLSAGASSIIAGSSREDQVSLQRFLNWHFYDAYLGTEQAMGKTWYGANKSIHAHHAERVEQLITSIDNMSVIDIYDLSGRLLHHLQDMVVPAHVAPNFHYSFIDFGHPDVFDELKLWKKPRYIWQRRTCEIEPVAKEGLRQAFPALLQRNAKRTLSKIAEQIPVPSDHKLAGQTWEAFWTIRDPQDEADYIDVKPGFAPYGYLGRDAFAALCQSDKELCETFFYSRYTDAVDASVQALLLINHVLNQYQQKQADGH